LRMELAPVLHGAIEVVPERREVAERARVLVVGQALAIARQAGFERIAAADDDARAGQHRADRADVEPVVRQLVGEAGPARAPGRRAFEVTPAEAPPVVALCRTRPVLQRLIAPARFLGEYARQIRQLAGALDLGV